MIMNKKIDSESTSLKERSVRLAVTSSSHIDNDNAKDLANLYYQSTLEEITELFSQGIKNDEVQVSPTFKCLVEIKLAYKIALSMDLMERAKELYKFYEASFEAKVNLEKVKLSYKLQNKPPEVVYNGKPLQL